MYKVTSKKINEALQLELARRVKYQESTTRKLKKFSPIIKDCYYVDSSADYEFSCVGVELKDGSDKSAWKKTHHGLFVPKRNTKVLKAFSDKYNEITARKVFFNDVTLLCSLGYTPDSRMESKGNNRVTFNIFKPGWKDGVFYFSGYKGYTPKRGIKEILDSEYERVFS